MKVTIAVEMDIDADAWSDVFGTAATPAAVRADVLSDVVNYIHLQNEDRGIPVTVTRKTCK